MITITATLPMSSADLNASFLSYFSYFEADRSSLSVGGTRRRLGERLLRQAESTDNGGRTINTINANLSTNGQLRPFGSRAPFTARKLDASVTLAHCLGDVAALADQAVRVAGNVVVRPFDPSL